MNAFIKSSIGLVLLTAIAVYLYLAPGDKSFDAARSQPQDAICKQDGERLARLRARPSLDEGLRFVGEIRCMQLWPQLQTLLDGLSDPSRSTASFKLDPAASDTTSGSDAALSPGATSSATLDDAFMMKIASPNFKNPGRRGDPFRQRTQVYQGEAATAGNFDPVKPRRRIS